MLNQILKILQIRLIAPNILREVVPPERDPLQRSSECLLEASTVYVTQRHQLVELCQALACGYCVWERGPGTDAGAEGRRFGFERGVRWDREIGGEALIALGEEEVVAKGWLRFLQEVFVVVEFGGEACAVRVVAGFGEVREERGEGAHDGSLPIDERAVDVEGEELEREQGSARHGGGRHGEGLGGHFGVEFAEMVRMSELVRRVQIGTRVMGKR